MKLLSMANSGTPWLTVAGGLPLLGAIVIAAAPGAGPPTARRRTGRRATAGQDLALAFSC